MNWRFPGGAVVKNLPARAGNTRVVVLIPAWGRSPGEGNGNSLPYSCLENSMDRRAWWATIHGVTRFRRDLAMKPPPPPAPKWTLFKWTSLFLQPGLSSPGQWFLPQEPCSSAQARLGSAHPHAGAALQTGSPGKKDTEIKHATENFCNSLAGLNASAS